MAENIFSQNLKNARLEAKLSQKELAQKIGVAYSTYSLYESGRREPNIDTIKKISIALNTSTDVLLGISIKRQISVPDFTSDEQKIIDEFKDFVKSRRNK